MHAGFQMGGNPPSLVQSLIEECNIDSVNGINCAPLRPIIDTTVHDACQPYPNEFVPMGGVGTLREWKASLEMIPIGKRD
jgi:hypothetical protein